MKFRFFWLSLLTLVFVPTMTFSQTTTASSSESGGFFKTVINSVTGIKEGVQEQITGEKPLRDAVLTKRIQERIINLAANISNRFDGLIARLDNIAGRLQKRIDKQKLEGYDVSAAETSLTTARAELTAAKDEMRTIDTSVRQAIGSIDPRGEWRGVRVQFLTTRDHIKAAHASLRETITLLKTSTPGAPIPSNATSTATSS